MNTQNLVYKIALSKIPMVGPVTAKTIISYCGSVEAVFEASKGELMKIPGIGEKITDSILQSDVFDQAEMEANFIEENGIHTLFYLDKNYPSRLKHFPDSPVMLYYKGTADLNHHRIVGMVGTRQPTPQGLMHCEELVEALRPYNVLVVSGLAFGVDVAAHRKCLEMEIPTVGVLGHGLDQVYPATHHSVAEKMLKNGGLLTEFTSHTKPDKENFPMRNRIIAGLCDALIVVETAIKGGSMITAQIANNYNKDVFAVPGRLRDKFSQGCNNLIKTNRAALLESIDDIAYIMRWDADTGKQAKQQQLFIELTEQERLLVDLMQTLEEAGIDRLMHELQLSTSAVAALLLELEFKGVVRSLPGKRYVLT